MNSHEVREVVRMRKKKRLCSRSATVMVSIMVAVAALLIVMRLLGYNIYTVMSGSMEPTLPVGAIVYVKTVDYKELQVGDIISYVADSSNTVVTHRIVDIETNMDDATELRFRTQGDANNVADGQAVHYKNVLGTPVVVVPLLGYVVFWLQRPPGIYIALVLGTLLVGWVFKPEARRKRRRKIAEVQTV